jgi:hypothetical protein
MRGYGTTYVPEARYGGQGVPPPAPQQRKLLLVIARLGWRGAYPVR